MRHPSEDRGRGTAPTRLGLVLLLLPVGPLACGSTSESLPEASSPPATEARPAPDTVPYPPDVRAYYTGVVRHIRSCFDPPPGVSGSGEATVYFVIEEDGSQRDLRLERGSGDPRLDSAALKAIRVCGTDGGFGPLPDASPWDRLPIMFSFRPAGGGAD